MKSLLLLLLAACTALAQVATPNDPAFVANASYVAPSGVSYYYPTNLPSFAATTWWVTRDMATNSSISTVTNRLGDGLSMTNTAGSTSPSRLAAEINGIDAIFFDGVNDFMQCDPIAISQPVTVFMVLSVTNEAANQLIFSGTNSTTKIQNAVGDDFTANAGSALTRDGVTNLWMGLAVVFNGASGQVWTNMVQSGANANFGANNLAGMYWSREGGGFYARWKLAEMATYAGAASAANISNWFNYVTNVYGTASFGL
jgi:hypothetical protein